MQLIPARGRKPCSKKSETLTSRVATYPREGTETFFIALKFNMILVATYPREGTETGTKNVKFIHGLLQLIPARGRKLGRVGHQANVLVVATYPREGTETSCLKPPALSLALQLIPARGRKLIAPKRPLEKISCNLSPRGDGNVYNNHARACANVATYPREGTETPQSSRMQSVLAQLQLIPARGRKRLSLHQFLNRYTQRCNLSPRGDGNSSP